MLLTFFTILSIIIIRSETLTTECRRKDAEVLILGAGMAGISAAKTLSEKAITDFILLEADDEIGGRVKSIVLKSGVRLELGANWIQGIDPEEPEKHPLWKIVENCGGLDGRFVQAVSINTMHVFNLDGKNITESTLFKMRFAQWNKIFDALIAYSLQKQRSHSPDMSLREALDANGWFPHSYMDSLIEWYGSDYGVGYGTSPENVSLFTNIPEKTYTDFGDPDRVTDYFVSDQENGFVKVVECLADGFLTENDSRLHLDTKVTEIDWSDSECVCVTVREAGTVREYCAPHAIVTFSLGVLKSDAVKFLPPLPTIKQKAINKDEMGLYLKIFLEFEHIFWKGETHVDSILHVDSARGKYVHFQPFNPSIPILFTTVTGEMAKMIYKQSVNKTTDQIMKVLRKIYGTSIPNPIDVHIPDWWVNPLYQGMYTSPPCGFEKAEFETLAQPVGRLHFGGEATSIDYFGFVHGAYYSGINVANEIGDVATSMKNFGL